MQDELTFPPIYRPQRHQAGTDIQAVAVEAAKTGAEPASLFWVDSADAML